MGDGPNDEGHSRAHLINACEESLKRLNTDYIDLYQVHSFDFFTPLEETMETLHYLVQTGKVRYIGISNFFAWQIMKLQSIAEIKNLSRITSLQAYYSLLGRDLEHEQVPVCADQGIGIIVWSPLHGGILSGKYRNKNNWPEGTGITKPGAHFPYDENKAEDIFTVMEKITYAKNKTFGQIALNYLLNKPGISSVIIGARNEHQLIENIGAAGWSLDANEMDMLDKASEPARPYPLWYFDVFKKEKMKKYFDKLYQNKKL